MKKIHIIFVLLITLAFLTACTNKDNDVSNTCISPENMKEACASYCSSPTTQETLPPEPEAPPVIVQSITDKVIFSEPIPNVGTATIKGIENSITITFKNNKNSTITLPLTGESAKYSKSECKTPTMTATHKGKPVEALVTEIESGDTFTITWDCQALDPLPVIGSEFSADLKFNYKVTSSGTIYAQMGTIKGKYE